MKKNTKSIKKDVLSAISSNDVKIKPKWHFALKSFAVVLFILILFLLFIYLVSLLLFVLRVNDIMLMHGLGVHGVRVILFSFPWYIAVIAFLSLMMMRFFGRQYPFFYRKTFSIFLLITLAVGIVGILVFDTCSVHQSLYSVARKGQLPVGGRMYRNLANLDIKDVYRGKIIKEDNEVKIELEGEIVLSVVITKETKGKKIFHETDNGEQVIIIGDIENDTVIVNAFRKLKESEI